MQELAGRHGWKSASASRQASFWTHFHCCTAKKSCILGIEMGGCKVKSIHSKIHVLKLNTTVSKMIQFYCRYAAFTGSPKIFCLDSVLKKKSGRLAFEKKGLQDKSCKRAQVAVEETLLLFRFLVSRNVHSFSETLVKTCWQFGKWKSEMENCSFQIIGSSQDTTCAQAFHCAKCKIAQEKLFFEWLFQEFCRAVFENRPKYISRGKV